MSIKGMKTLDELLQALDEGGALTYVPCGTHAFKVYFDKSVGAYGEDKRPTAQDIRFLDTDYDSNWQADVEVGMCGTLVDVYISKHGEDDDDECEADPGTDWLDDGSPF